MPEEEPGWKYTPDSADVDTSDQKPEQEIKKYSWTATNSPVNKKKVSWYVYLGIITLAVSALVLFLTNDKITTGVVIFCGLLFGIYGTRKPREIKYSINDVGFTIGGKEYGFSKFKSFSIISTANHGIVALTPLKRFVPYLYINFNKDDESKIAPIIGQKLPIDKGRIDPIDRFIRYIGL